MQQATSAAESPRRGQKASEAVSTALRKLISDQGESAAVEFLGLSRQTVARLFGGLPVQPSTLVCAASRLGVDLRGTIADSPPPGAGDRDGGP